MTSVSLADWVGLAVFLASWFGYRRLMVRADRAGTSLTAAMNMFREEWMRQMASREARIVDASLMNSLQNGTAFFASTSLIALGGTATLLRGTDDVLRLFSDLPLGPGVSRGLWEAKVVGLATLYGYSFFKFAWAYRLYNYCAILVGATPAAGSPDRRARERAVARTSEMSISAGRSFSDGQRAFYFSFAYIGWFLGPYALIVTTAIITYVIWRRQFHVVNLPRLNDDPLEEEAPSWSR